MSRRQVIELVCDRCQRVETRPPDEIQHEGSTVSVTFKGETVTYDDLCRRCEETISNQFMRMTKQKDEGKEEDVESESPKKGGLLSRVAG